MLLQTAYKVLVAVIRASRKNRYLEILNKIFKSPRSCKRLALVTLLLSALIMSVLWISGPIGGVLSRFKTFRFDPEPRLLPSEAEAVMAAFPLPVGLMKGKAAPLTAEKRIHFMYKGYLLDNQIRPFLTSWRQVYPEYKLYFWTDKEITELVKRRYPTWQHMYHQQLSNYLERSDTARAFVLNTMGGWYADVDAGSLRRADDVAAAHALVLPLEPYVHAMENFNKRRLVSNAIMYSVAGHPFWMYFLQRLNASLVGRAPRNDTLAAAFVTGPMLLTKAALLFIQAHTGKSCPGYWCPHLAKPVHFMPTYDDHTAYMREQLQLFCTYTITHPAFSEDCSHYRRHNYYNHLDSTQSYTFHAFMHLNERKGGVRSESDVRNWGLKLITGDEILAGF